MKNMKWSTDNNNYCSVFPKRSGVLGAGMLSILIALGGCGGGGGGGGGGVPTTTGGTIVFPDLEDATPDQISGFVAPYAYDPAEPKLRSVDLTVIGAGSIGGQLEITVAAIDLPNPAGIEPGFRVTLDLTDSGNPLGNGPLGGLCPDCLRTSTAPYFPVGGGPSPGDVTFIYLDPDPDPNPAFFLTYSTLGMWSKPTIEPTAPPWLEVGGPFSAGVTAIHLPATGTANYAGFFIGRYASELSDSGTYIVGADARAVVNFGLPAVTSFFTENTMISRELGGGTLAPPVVAPNLDLRMNPLAPPMTIDNNPNSPSFASFEGGNDTLENGFGMGVTGEITGGFYGPSAGVTAPPELGGALAVGNADDTRSMVGSFGLKKQ